tara:strand:- start:6 stop:491 length:486 start_codon:yes stop_codon:yes gene_type:complete
MSLSIDDNIHPQVRIFVTMLCEGFNVPNSETKIQAFSDKLKNPHSPALRETYNIFTDGRASTNKMPTIAEVMEVYNAVTKRLTMTAEQSLLENVPKEVDFKHSKKMFHKLLQMVQGKVPTYKHPIDNDTVDWQDGYKFTLSRNDKGQDYVYYHNHPNNHRN